jgi:hypothetical protein
LPVWLSDALCLLASGGSFAVRQLYTDDEEVLFEAARPILLNGIEEVVSRPDLGDRAIFLTLAPIGEAQRRPESELWRETLAPTPPIAGPRSSDRRRPSRRLRAGHHGGAQLVDGQCRRPSAYRRRSQQRHVGDSAGWPKNPRALAGRLRRAHTFLRALGIDIAFGREGRAGSRVIRMHTTVANTVSTVSTVRSVRDDESPSWSGQSRPGPADDVCNDNCFPDLVGP